jgi:hypothetical protein
VEKITRLTHREEKGLEVLENITSFLRRLKKFHEVTINWLENTRLPDFSIHKKNSFVNKNFVMNE